MDVFELESELVLLNLFNFKLNLTNEFNKCNILDENNNIIGFIEKKVIGYANGNPRIGIYTEFITDDMIYKNIREIKYNNINSYKYSIAKRNNDGSLIYVNLKLGKTREISFKHNNHIAYLKLKGNELSLELKSKVLNYETIENLKIYTSNKEKFNKSYKYVIDFNNGVNERKVFSVTGDELYHYFIPSIGEIFEPSFRLNTRIVTNGKMIENNYYEINDIKIKDLIIKHNDGLELFNHFKYLANNILPFKKEVISYIFDIRNLPLEFLMFVSKDYRGHLKKVKNKN